jgi:hypothetical protein
MKVKHAIVVGKTSTYNFKNHKDELATSLMPIIRRVRGRTNLWEESTC